MTGRPKLLSFSNTAWYLSNYRVPIDRLLRDEGWEIVFASPDDEFRERIEAAGFRWHHVPMSRSGVNPLEEFQTARRLAEIVRHERPDILHTFTMKGNVNGSWAARLAGLPRIVNSIAGLGYVYSSNAPKARLLRPAANLAYRAVLSRGEVIFQNREDLEAFVRQGLVAESRAHLIRSSGVDITLFQPADRSASIPRILYASRLLWTKGIGELVEAARILRRKGVRFEILVAGQPDPGNPESIREGDLEGWVSEGLIRYLGFRNDMAQLMQDSDLVCFPSKHKEGTPKFLVEAAAAGLPIVTTHNRGCIEAVRDGVNGLLVPVGEADSLAAALDKLIRDPDLRRRMGRAGRTLAEKEFSIERVARETLAVYRQALRG